MMTRVAFFLSALFFSVAALVGCNGGICDPGTLGCDCLEAGGCRLTTLACLDGVCVDHGERCDESGRCAPIDPHCYSPCDHDVTEEDGTIRACGDEGLMEGCLEGSVCRIGTCVPQVLIVPEGIEMAASRAGLARAPGTCAVETDCPTHQTCIAGGCFSNCSPETECAPQELCVLHVCRAACREGQPCEQDGYSCHDGVCLPISAPDAMPERISDGNFGLFDVDGREVSALRFSSGREEAEISLRNDSRTSQTFIVRKVEERVVADDGGSSYLRSEAGDLPLPWLEMGLSAPLRVQEFPVTVGAGSEVSLRFAGARVADRPLWSGRIEVEHAELGVRALSLTYAESPRGRWSGTVYYFGNFEDGLSPITGESALDQWVADRTNAAALEGTQNALLQVWSRFVEGRLELAEFQALLAATTNGAWQDERTQELCAEHYGPGAACAPFGGSGSSSVLLYTSAANADRIPSGIVQLGASMNLREATPDETASRCGGGANCLVGRIDSQEALQYPNDPEVALRFETDPVGCMPGATGACMARLASFDTTVHVGGRYAPTDSDLSCVHGEDLLPREVPWLVNGFSPRGATPFGQPDRTLRQCADSRVPFGDGLANQLFATANPIPDGRARARRLSLVDGVMANQDALLLLIKEEADGFDRAGMQRLPSYSLMILERQPEELSADDFQGNRADDLRVPPVGLLDRACDPALVARVSGEPARDELSELADFQRENLARAVVRGHTGLEDPSQLDRDDYAVHYLCIFADDVVLEDGAGGREEARTIQRQVFGAGTDGMALCQPWGTAIYFALDREVFGLDFDPTTLPCNDRPLGGPETCLETLRGWAAVGFEGATTNASGEPILHLLSRRESVFRGDSAAAGFDLTYRCADTNLVSCDNDRRDMLAGKVFLAPVPGEVFWAPLATEIHDAFRYKSQFASRTGQSAGFAPDLCQGSGTSLVPYCYDPLVIEEVVARTDCALALYQAHLAAAPTAPERLGDPTAAILRDYLRQSFSQLQTDNPYGDPIVEDGFERLYAELLIMLGDEALTASFASRFDLSGSSSLAFEGSAFEAGGVDLEGAVGLEMYKLHEAIQYYDLVLDRFYGLVPEMWESLSHGATNRYLTQRTVTSYIQRVIQASTQRARAAAEIGRRYQLMNRSDLARTVIERSYARAYNESQILTQVMRAIMGVLEPSALAQVISEIETAQRRYRIAMLDMREGYDRISDGVNYFGLPPDYVPFPALDEDDVNGFEVTLGRAFDRLDRAIEDEDRAISSRREFDVDEAAFQGELIALGLDYQAQLGDLCGTFVADDGRVYPAIRQYAYLSPLLAEFDDPCGSAGNGALWLKGADLQTRELELSRVRQEVTDIQRQTDLLIGRVARQCELIDEDAVRFLEHQRAVDGLEDSIVGLENTVNGLDRTLELVSEAAARFAGIADAAASPDPTQTIGQWIAGIIASAASALTYLVVGTIHLVSTSIIDGQIRSKQRQIGDRERSYEVLQVRRECDYLQAELVSDLRELHLGIDILELDILNAIWNVQVEISEIQRLNNQRLRLEAEWRDSRQLSLDVAVAQNDPNRRIYKNEAIISAERSFDDALQRAYAATRIYEYYTASSYPGWEELFLSRTAFLGQHNLRRYLIELEDAFFTFEHRHGSPETRVAIISLKDDIFRIPHYSEDGLNRTLGQDERTELFRERLMDPSLIDDQGRLSVAFPTTFDMLSPLTVNHKILFIEVEMFGEGTGDSVGRIYLRQRGTGVVEGTDGERRYYPFPARTAVMNPLFNGDRNLGQDSDGAIAGPNRSIYRSYRFRERPFVQTQWELQLDQRNESVNQDINLNGIDDVWVYVFYTDFTAG